MSAYYLIQEVCQWPNRLTPDFPFVRAYLNMIPGLMMEMGKNEAFARAIPRLSGGLCQHDTREEEDIVEDILSFDEDNKESRRVNKFLGVNSHEAHARMIGTIMGWSGTDLERVIMILDRFAQTYVSKPGSSPQSTEYRIAELLIEHIQSLQAYAKRVAGVRRGPRAVRFVQSGEEIMSGDMSGSCPVGISETGELAKAIRELIQVDH